MKAQIKSLNMIYMKSTNKLMLKIKDGSIAWLKEIKEESHQQTQLFPTKIESIP